ETAGFVAITWLGHAGRASRDVGAGIACGDAAVGITNAPDAVALRSDVCMIGTNDPVGAFETTSCGFALRSMITDGSRCANSFAASSVDGASSACAAAAGGIAISSVFGHSSSSIGA